MTQNLLYDLVNNVTKASSNVTGTNLSGSSADNGDSVDCQPGEGPVHGDFQVGEATGSPDSFTVTCTLEESDTGSSAWTALATQTALVLSADKGSGFVRGIRTKRYVRCVMAPAFVGGSSPAIDCNSSVVYARKSW